MLDLVLAIAHHLAVFSLVALVVAEFFVMQPGIAGARLRQLGRLDALYGLMAVLVIVAGVLRVWFGAMGPAYYLANWVFWAKMAAFAAVGLISIAPTRAIFRWRKAASAADYTPPAAEIARARMFFIAELVLIAFIPAFAAAMARGYGVL
jgi:putative membrane protein